MPFDNYGDGAVEWHFKSAELGSIGLMIFAYRMRGVSQADSSPLSSCFACFSKIDY